MNRLPHLDERLSIAAALFPACAYGADIGADHGRLSCVLLGTGVCQRMCVADISEASLEKARRLLRLHGVADRADLVTGDGLSVLRQPAQAIAILGMGGQTLSDILRRGQDRLRGAALILSAHTELPLARRAVSDIQYHIETERIAHAAGRFYVVIRAAPGGETYTEKQQFLGPRLMETVSEHHAAYIAWRMGVSSRKRTAEAQRELRWLKEEEERVGYGGND